MNDCFTTKHSKTMPVSRFLFFSSKRRSTEAFNLLKREPYQGLTLLGNVHTSHKASCFLPAAILGFAGLATFVHYNDERRAILKGQGSKSGGNTVKGPTIGGPFTLIDTKNQIVTEQDFYGKWVLLYFGYTSSPDVGPEQVRIIAKAVDILESKYHNEILPVFVTIDPQRDTPAQLHAYLREFDSRILGLTGPVSAIRQMAQEYRIFFKKIEEEGDDYLVESSHNMYLLNPKLEVARCFGVEYNAEELSEAITKELRSTPS
ncbi:protein SCO1 homolog 2, mitochondrial isoform X2 [Juglans microcarpa x Juglans regia]|uniref:protein SCO1 homolog 2, mitochondrial isoform X2 n=1 Tax=Juglans microcarpa x Juglans regia TaxID=2249226 RepID=UPI001B7D9E5D|nr:protein SCO1 homolog 2, mitochondrial isoform X2 [Juglans microcarpa x Juglans regia]